MSEVTTPSSQIENLASEQTVPNRIDEDSSRFFQLCLFLNVQPDYSSVNHLFSKIIADMIKKDNKISLTRIFLVLSFRSFKKVFIPKIMEEIKKVRNAWLLANCQPELLLALNSKESRHYFQSLENKKLLEYISHFTLLENWIYKEYKKERYRLLVSIIKRNKNSLFLWVVIFSFVFVSFMLSARDNSLSLTRQIVVWIHFILGKN